MDQTDRRGWAEARLYTLYERCFADLQQDILRIDPGHSPGSANSMWPKKLAWEEFRNYLRRSDCNSEIRRHWVERLLLLAAPEEQPALRDAFDPVLHGSRDTGPFDVDDERAPPTLVKRPHFLSKRQREPSGDSG